MSHSFQTMIRERLQSLGFTWVGFAQPPLGPPALRFQDWLQAGFAGEMAYLGRRAEERIHPEKILPQLKSVIVAAFPYDPGEGPAAAPDEGNISRYALGEDYHQVLADKLQAFTAWFRGQGAKVFQSIDASPVLEKAWAEQGGLGWIGKHTNVIREEAGSYFFLIALLTDQAFAPDPPAVDRCGTCSECIRVCPTQAIVAPYVLDARRCISYLTIELKGPIPRELRPLIGNHIFGCDDCQEVCPWNRFSRPTAEGRFFPREGVRHRPLVEFLSLSEAEFKRRFAGSAILRAKRRGFLRNVCVAIGNSGRPELAQALHPVLADAEPLVRGHAVWAYARLLGKEAFGLLQKMNEAESDVFVLEELQAALP